MCYSGWLRAAAVKKRPPNSVAFKVKGLYLARGMCLRHIFRGSAVGRPWALLARGWRESTWRTYMGPYSCCRKMTRHCRRLSIVHSKFHGFTCWGWHRDIESPQGGAANAPGRQREVPTSSVSKCQWDSCARHMMNASVFSDRSQTRRSLGGQACDCVRFGTVRRAEVRVKSSQDFFCCN